MDHPQAPEWNRRKANALLLAQAARLEALAELLERKQLVTRSELTRAARDIIRNEKARLIATMTMPDDSENQLPDA
jgi:hypothetical protein